MKRKKVRVTKSNILFLILDILALTCIFLAYGPITYFKNLLVTTSMATMSHHYLARTIYTDKMIADVLSKNYVDEIKGNTNTSDITIDNKDDGNYDSIYEEQILKRDEGNDLYKVIPIEEGNYKGYLVAIYDPSRIFLGISSKLERGGEQLDDLAESLGAKVAMNASGFYNTGGLSIRATGTVIKDGKIFSTGGGTGFTGGLVGFNKDHVLVLTKEDPMTAIEKGMVDAVEFGPFLIVNGEESNIVGNGGYGVAPRSAIGQRKDGIVLFLVIDGRNPGYSIGADMNDMIKIFKRYKAHNAVNLDGGGSSTLIVDGKLMNNPKGYGYEGGRYLANSWMVK